MKIRPNSVFLNTYSLGRLFFVFKYVATGKGLITVIGRCLEGSLARVHPVSKFHSLVFILMLYLFLC